ncbi:MAG: class I SAM-dependent methyltransferase [Planctomycetota bacterium]|jgi:methyltransferase (TIGR00027 family)
MRLFSLLVFLVLQVLFFPLAIVGVAIITYRQMIVSKRMGVSQTAIEVLNGRWAMHVFGLREDDATVRLAEALPNTSVFGLWLCLFPLWVKYKLCGVYWLYPRIPEEGSESLGNLLPARTIYFDRLIERAIGDMEQFVLLGAGYDTRAYREPRPDGLTIFEVDQAAVQKAKIAGLQEAGVDAAHVRFVEVDFSRDELFDRLRTAGYDPGKKTLFIWEGVTPYLAEADVKKTMRDIRANAAAGSAVLADIYAERFVRRGKRGTVGGKALAYTGEVFEFGLPFDSDHEQTLRAFVESEGVQLGATFFLGESRKQGPWAVVAEFRV